MMPNLFQKVVWHTDFHKSHTPQPLASSLSNTPVQKPPPNQLLDSTTGPEYSGWPSTHNRGIRHGQSSRVDAGSCCLQFILNLKSITISYCDWIQTFCWNIIFWQDKNRPGTTTIIIISNYPQDYPTGNSFRIPEMSSSQLLETPPHFFRWIHPRCCPLRASDASESHTSNYRTCVRRRRMVESSQGATTNSTHWTLCCLYYRLCQRGSTSLIGHHKPM